MFLLLSCCQIRALQDSLRGQILELVISTSKVAGQEGLQIPTGPEETQEGEKEEEEEVNCSRVVQ